MAAVDKKVKLTPKAHEIAKAYCHRRNVRMKRWVSRLIVQSVEPQGTTRPALLDNIGDGERKDEGK